MLSIFHYRFFGILPCFRLKNRDLPFHRFQSAFPKFRLSNIDLEKLFKKIVDRHTSAVKEKVTVNFWEHFRHSMTNLRLSVGANRTEDIRVVVEVVVNLVELTAVDPKIGIDAGGTLSVPSLPRLGQQIRNFGDG